MVNMEKKIYIGKTKPNNTYQYGQPIAITVERRDEGDKVILLMSGNIGRSNFGQINNTLRKLVMNDQIEYTTGWNEDKLMKLLDVWEKWHLNNFKQSEDGEGFAYEPLPQEIRDYIAELPPMTAEQEKEYHENDIIGFTEKHGITATVTQIDHNRNLTWNNLMNHYKVTLKMGKKRMTVYFSQGLGIENDPTADVVLDCLLSDALTIEQTRDFNEWVYMHGSNNDTFNKHTYKTITKNTIRLKKFLGEELYKQLLQLE